MAIQHCISIVHHSIPITRSMSRQQHSRSSQRRKLGQDEYFSWEHRVGRRMVWTGQHHPHSINSLSSEELLSTMVRIIGVPIFLRSRRRRDHRLVLRTIEPMVFRPSRIPRSQQHLSGIVSVSVARMPRIQHSPMWEKSSSIRRRSPAFRKIKSNPTSRSNTV